MKNILIIVDVQNGFITDEMTKTAADRIDMLVKSGVFDLVAASKYVNYPENHILRLMGWDKLMTDEEQQLVSAAKSAQFIAEKSVYSAATTEMMKWLRECGGGEMPETVFIVGVDTECCVLATAIDLFESGVRPIVLSYYCASSGGELYHQAGLYSLYHLIGRNNVFALPIAGDDDISAALKWSEHSEINFTNAK